MPIKSQMETIWSSAHSVIKVSDNPVSWVSIDPVSAFMQKPSSDNGDLVLNIGIVANLVLSSNRPPTPQAEPLPPLNKQALDGMDGFKVNLPIQLDYGMLSKELTATIGDKAIEFELPNGDAKVNFKEVAVYPAAPRLVVAARIEADLPDQWLDTKGWIYVYATPKFDPSRMRLVLTDIEFSRAVDNKVASALTLVLRQKLIAKLNKLATIELKAPLDVAIARTNTFLNERLDQHIRGALAKQAGQFGINPRNIDVAGGINSLDAVDITLLENVLVVTPTVRGNLSVTYRPTTLIAPDSRPAAAANAP